MNAGAIVIGALVAGALTTVLPAAAADLSTFSVGAGLQTGMAGRQLSDAEMGDLRGRYAPGSTVIIQVGNGSNPSTTTSQYNPAVPGSATASTTGNTTVTGSASTSYTTTTSSISRTSSFGGSFSTSYRIR